MKEGSSPNKGNSTFLRREIFIIGDLMCDLFITDMA